jgi:hypothetical protein
MTTVIKIIHEDGVCKVPIFHYPGKFVTLYQDDLEALISLGVNMQWKYANGTVWTQSGGKRISVARLIRDAGIGEQVFFIDRDPLNMLRENLVLAPGRGRYRARDNIVSSHRFLKDQVEIEHDVR